jgi:hypothetical protein
MRHWLVIVPFLAASAFAQVAEISVGGGASKFGGGSPGTLDLTGTGPEIEVDGGFRLDIKLALNPYRFFGHEIGYAYSRSTYKLPAEVSIPEQPAVAQEVGVNMHTFGYNFVVHATPEGSVVRPFVTGGGQFSSFFPPGASVYYGNQITKFGFNYGFGLKVRVTSIWGLRFDVRQYSSGHPFDFPNADGLLRQTAYTGSITFNL